MTIDIDVIGYVAGTLGLVSLLPQLMKCYKTRSTEDLSAWRYIIYIASTALWIIYGIAIHNGPITIMSSLILVISTLILYFALKYD